MAWLQYLRLISTFPRGDLGGLLRTGGILKAICLQCLMWCVCRSEGLRASILELRCTTTPVFCWGLRPRHFELRRQ